MIGGEYTFIFFKRKGNAEKHKLEEGRWFPTTQVGQNDVEKKEHSIKLLNGF